MIERLTDLDYVHELAFAAVVHDDARDKFVGISRYSTRPTGPAASAPSPSSTTGRARAWAAC